MITSRHIIINDHEFTQALRDCIRASSKAVSQVINEKALKVCSFAYQQTRHANADKIRWQLGQTAQEMSKVSKRGAARYGLKAGALYMRKGYRGVVLGKVGELEVVRRMTKGRGKASVGNLKWDKPEWAHAYRTALQKTLAYRIVLRDVRKKAGPGPLPVSDKWLYDQARKLIAARVRSVKYISSGWLWSLDDLWRRVRKDMGTVDPRAGAQWGDRKREIWNSRRLRGYNVPAKATDNFGNAFAVIENASLGERKGVEKTESAKVMVGEVGLRRGFMLATADMRSHLERKLQTTFNKFSA